MKIRYLELIVCSLVFGVISSNVVFAQRELSKEAIVFLATREAVFTVYGSGGHGSGFLVDKAGLVLTNSHVIGSPRHISVQISPEVRVRAVLIVEDKQEDIAVLYVNPKVIENLPILKIARRPTEDLAFEGEKVIAIGSPLHQVRILTSGIVSKMEKHAIISDININPGNSGGPMINMDTEVVAINTFRDPTLGGSGISGSVPITIAQPILSRARNKLPESDAPDPTHLPVVPSDAFPLEGLKWAAERSGMVSNYAMDASGFNVQILTPSREHFLKIASTKGRLAHKRRSRERFAGVPQEEIYDPVGDELMEWKKYVGEYMPLVLINVEPKTGETSDSLLLNILGAAAAGYSGTPYYGLHTYEFKSDLQDFVLIDGGSPIPEVFRAMDIMPVSESRQTPRMVLRMEDIAQWGIFAFRPEVFESRNLLMRIRDLKQPGKVIDVPVPPAFREQILVDFEPYSDMLRAKEMELVLPRN